MKHFVNFEDIELMNVSKIKNILSLKKFYFLKMIKKKKSYWW